jgi:DNA-binding transcriptional LysR family regulator
VPKPPANWFIRSRLKTRQLVLLVYLDEFRSVLRAASAAGMTQPAASKLLRELEETFDVQLFERQARGVAPTWYGEILIRHARSVLSEISRAQEEIAALKSGLTGQASIGTVLNPGTNLVPLAVAQLKQKHPGMLVRIELDYSKPLIAKLLKGELDIVIARILDSHGAEELQVEPLADERHAVIAGGAHPLAGRRDLQLEDLVDQGWILPPSGSLIRDRLISAFLQRGLMAPSNLVESFSLPIITNLLRDTNMVVALPKETVQPYCEIGMLTVLIEDIGIEIGSFGIVTRRSHALSPGAQAMLVALKTVAREVYKSSTG